VTGAGRNRRQVAIDGPSGSGKSTVGRRVAQALGWDYLDTGAMYRAVALKVLAEPDPAAALERAGALARAARIDTAFDARTLSFRIHLDGRDVSDEVRSPRAARWASRVATVAEVRVELVARQRRLAAPAGMVMEGRDIGTVVLPDAAFKFFLDATVGERSRRRHGDEGGEAAAVAGELAERDRQDASRAASPLRPAADAVVIDTTGLDLEQVVALVLAHVGGP
jgi:cytidylate kinase